MRLTSLLLSALVATAVPGLALAQSSAPPPEQMQPYQPQPSYIACTYDGAGNFTDSDSAFSNEHPGPLTRDRGGYRLVIEAPDGRSCPRKVQTGG